MLEFAEYNSPVGPNPGITTPFGPSFVELSVQVDKQTDMTRKSKNSIEDLKLFVKEEVFGNSSKFITGLGETVVTLENIEVSTDSMEQNTKDSNNFLEQAAEQKPLAGDEFLKEESIRTTEETNVSIQELQGKLSKLTEAYQEGLISGEVYRKKQEEWIDEISSLEKTMKSGKAMETVKGLGSGVLGTLTGGLADSFQSLTSSFLGETAAGKLSETLSGAFGGITERITTGFKASKLFGGKEEEPSIENISQSIEGAQKKSTDRIVGAITGTSQQVSSLAGITESESEDQEQQLKNLGYSMEDMDPSGFLGDLGDNLKGLKGILGKLGPFLSKSMGLMGKAGLVAGAGAAGYAAGTLINKYISEKTGSKSWLFDWMGPSEEMKESTRKGLEKEKYGKKMKSRMSAKAYQMMGGDKDFSMQAFMKLRQSKAIQAVGDKWYTVEEAISLGSKPIETKLIETKLIETKPIETRPVPTVPISEPITDSLNTVGKEARTAEVASAPVFDADGPRTVSELEAMNKNLAQIAEQTTQPNETDKTITDNFVGDPMMNLVGQGKM